jgi:hypothetical protein
VLVIGECQKYLGRNVDVPAIRCFPVDSLQVLSQVCAEFAQKAAERGVTFKIEQPRLMAQVLASSELTRFFSAVIELLLKDAVEDTVLSIDVEDTHGSASYRFSNCGFGIPNERLHEILGSPEPPDSEEFQVLREAISWIRSWDGNFEITSEVGKGYSIMLRLRQFPPSAFLGPRAS